MLLWLTKVAAIVLVLAGVAAGLIFLEQYVRKNSAADGARATVKLVAPPKWVNKNLESEVYLAASSGGQSLNIDKNTASAVYRNITEQFAWLKDVEVQTFSDGIYISGTWRKPLALVTRGFEKRYVDEQMVVLDFVLLPDLPIIRVEGLSSIPQMPPVGQEWNREDLSAAVEVLKLLNQRERSEPLQESLLHEIESIDVSNFNGRENPGFPHIVLYARDKTEIIWGAEVGRWQQHFEAKDEEKIAKLYAYYNKYGSLLEGAKYIDLCEPQENLPLPVDRY